MYRLLEKRDKIDSYNLEAEELFFQKTSDNKITILTKDSSAKIDKEVFGIPFYWNNYLVFSNVNKKKSSFWNNGKEIFRKEFDSVSHIGDYLITLYKKERKKHIQFLNKKLEVIFEKEFNTGGHYTAENLFVSLEVATANKINVFLVSDTIKFYSIDITNQQWSNLEGEKFDGEVFQIIGQWKNELLVSIGRFRIVSFDLEKGKELWRIDDFIEEVSLNPIIESKKRNSIKWLLSEVESKAYLLVLNYLFELDLNQKKSQLIKDYNNLGEKEWYFKYSRLCDNYITFSGANVLGKFPMVAGVIDRNTKEILWTTKCKPGIYFEEAPQIKEGKLYILDSSKTLHIFEEI
ncbi:MULTISPECIES: hypothetical protein [unclassified Cellulophaga]|uniref:hypothetical protein n=1 Tax=unclassified Cellulophaga TaxID=2634405 RepID=UPI0026E2C53D|nr:MULTISPECIES: hypothetical protein [unclassified Cellulophaga]MDO6490964.1 hypothetical protein [Cellulophaga sp. 2_MG-2023]MDO6493842.1 hypothetical protein [Cellulophaga sp. 3_MG-2023]